MLTPRRTHRNHRRSTATLAAVAIAAGIAGPLAGTAHAQDAAIPTACAVTGDHVVTVDGYEIVEFTGPSVCAGPDGLAADFGDAHADPSWIADELARRQAEMEGWVADRQAEADEHARRIQEDATSTIAAQQAAVAEATEPVETYVEYLVDDYVSDYLLGTYVPGVVNRYVTEYVSEYLVGSYLPGVVDGVLDEMPSPPEGGEIDPFSIAEAVREDAQDEFDATRRAALAMLSELIDEIRRRISSDGEPADGWLKRQVDEAAAWLTEQIDDTVDWADDELGASDTVSVPSVSVRAEVSAEASVDVEL